MPFTSIMADVKFVAALFVLFILCMSYFDVKHTPNDLDVTQTCSCINKDAFETRGHMPCWFTCIHNERIVVRVKIQLCFLAKTKRSKASTNYYHNSSATFRL